MCVCRLHTICLGVAADDVGVRVVTRVRELPHQRLPEDLLSIGKGRDALAGFVRSRVISVLDCDLNGSGPKIGGKQTKEVST